MEKPKQTRKKKRATKKRGAKKSFVAEHQLLLLLVGAVLLSACIVMSVFALKSYHGPAAWISIPQGATSQQVKDSLQTSLGSVDGNRVYMLWSMMGSSPTRARGRYKVTSGQAAWRTAWNLRRGAQTPFSVTWNNARTLPIMAERISRHMNFSAEEFLAAADSLLRFEGFDRYTAPAAFIPNSYEFYATATPEQVVKRLIKYRNQFWNTNRMAQAKSLGLTPIEVATIASIVEEESAKTDEWPTIARLYLNRIHRGMPLQADPTVKFATGDFGLRRITSAHLAIESPYNTYRHRGLPPGPIRIASAQAIDAVLTAPEHDYLYMCAKEDFSGRHNFTASYDEHRSNAARYQAELNRRGIK